MPGSVGGGSVWNTPAIDPKNGLALFAVANPNPDYQGEEPAGQQCLYQLHRRDAMSRPASSPGTTRKCRTICGTMTRSRRWCCSTPRIDGKIVPAAAEAGKVGNVYIVNRLTGELLHKTALREAERQHVRGAGRDPITRYPGINGGSLWSHAVLLAAHA